MKNFLKPFIWVISWLLLLSWVFAMVQWNNSKLELSQKSMVFTDDGTVWWDMVAWINTGWDSIFYWPLLDGGLNPFLTGYTETDPIFTANSGDYIPFSWSDTEVYWTIKFQQWAWLWSNPWVLDFGVASIRSVNPWLWSPYFEIYNSGWIWAPFSSIRIEDDLIKFHYISWGLWWTIHKLELWEWALEYKWDYSGNFVDWSLVDKRYVDWEIAWIETFWEFDWVTLNPTATWDISLKIWLGSQANTSNSASIGQYAWANWTGSYAFGNSAWALWEGSVAIGRQAEANGRTACSVWYNSKANQEGSCVFGVQSVANWFGSMTFWQYATSNNVFSTAIWYSSQANADYSISAGNNTITNSVSSMAIWKYNVWNADSVFEVGFGTNTGRANLFEVKNNWNIYISKLTGYTCLATDSVGMVYDNTGVFANYVPRTAVDTGWNNTGSDTIIPSEKTVWSLVSWLNNDYIPFWDGSKFINSSIFKTTDFLRLSFVSTWTFLSIYNDFMFASTNFVDWEITQNRFKIWAPDWLTTGVYIEWKMLDWVIDVYANTGVNLNTTDVVITGNIYADWSSVKFNTESFVWWFNSSAGGLKSASIWHNCQADGDFSIAIWSYSQAIWNSSISMWNQVKTYAHSSTALWRHTEARSEYWVVMGRYNVGNTDSLLEIWDGSTTTWYNEFEFKKDGRFIISDEWSFIVNASWNLDVQYLSGSSWETADTFTKS